MTMRITAVLMRGSGSLNGIAAQVSFPSMSTSRLIHWRTPGAAASRVPGTRRVVEDALEQLRVYQAIGCSRHVLARLCQFGIAGIVEAGSAAARLREPSIEIAGWHRLDDEPHPGKTVAAEICRKAGKFAGVVSEKVEMSDHAAHRVDLAAELRHEERIHHRRRGEPKFDGRSGWDD